MRFNDNRFDSGESLFLTRQLTLVETELYTQYPRNKARTLFPVVSLGAGLQAISTPLIDMHGQAKIVGNSATDSPNISININETIRPVRHIQASYSYSYYDLQNAVRLGVSLDSKKAMATARSMENTLEKATFGMLSSAEMMGTTGLFTSVSNYTEYVLPADGTGSSKLFSTKTGEQVYRDLAGLISACNTATKGIYQANTLILDVANYSLVRNTRLNTYNDTTVWGALMKAFPNLMIEQSVYLSGVTAGSFSNKQFAVAYPRVPDVVTLHIPTDFKQLPLQNEGLLYRVDCTMDFSGLHIEQPKAIIYAGNC